MELRLSSLFSSPSLFASTLQSSSKLDIRKGTNSTKGDIFDKASLLTTIITLQYLGSCRGVSSHTRLRAHNDCITVNECFANSFFLFLFFYRVLAKVAESVFLKLFQVSCVDARGGLDTRCFVNNADTGSAIAGFVNFLENMH